MSSKRLKILIYADASQDRLSQSLSYINFAARFGEPILVSADSDFDFWLEHGDILLLPGGADVDPNRYGEHANHMVRFINPQYETLDLGLLVPWLETSKPIIGICRGLQTLNVAAGGSLFQHIVGHALSDEDKKTRGLHEIYSDIDNLSVETTYGVIEEDFRIHHVNSRHHQGIKKLADGFEILAWSSVFKGCPTTQKNQSHYFDVKHQWYWDTEKRNNKEVRVIKKRGDAAGNPYQYYALPEIIRHTTKPYIAFQYHPEDIDDELAIALIEQTLSTYNNATEENA